MKTRFALALTLMWAASAQAQPSEVPRQPQDSRPPIIKGAKPNSRTAADFLERAQFFIQQQDWSAALAEIGQALALEPDNPTVLMAKGMVLNASGRPREAIEPLRRTAELRPNDARAHLEYGRSIMASEDPTRWREALAQFDEALRLRRDYPAAFEIKGALLAAYGDRVGVTATYKAWFYYHPRDPEVYAAYAAVLERLGDKKAALRAIETAMAAMEPDYKAFHTRSRLRLDTGDAEGALADVQTAIKLQPRSWSSYLLRARIRERQGDTEAALADLKAALDIWPAALEAVRVRADLYERLHRYDLAIKDIDRMLEIRPGNPSYLNQRCWTRAIANVELDAALADCSASLAARPNSSDTLDSLGLVHLRRGDYAAAIAAYDTALAGRPTLADSLYGRGIARLRTGATAAGDADLAAARKASGDIEAAFKSYGITP